MSQPLTSHERESIRQQLDELIPAPSEYVRFAPPVCYNYSIHRHEFSACASGMTCECGLVVEQSDIVSIFNDLFQLAEMVKTNACSELFQPRAELSDRASEILSHFEKGN